MSSSANSAEHEVTGPDRSWWAALRSGLSRWGAIVSVIAVTAAVGAVAAVISYAHQHALNRAHEVDATAWTASFWPATVEGIVLASGLVLVIRRRAGRPGGLIVWSAMLVGAAVTLAANVASAPIDLRTGEPDHTSQLMNAWPPLAFLFAVELLVIAFRPSQVESQDEARTDADQEVQPDQSEPAEPVQAQCASPLADEYFPAVQQLANKLGAQPTRQAVRDLTGVGATRADRLRSAVRVPDLSEQDKRAAERPTNGSSHA